MLDIEGFSSSWIGSLYEGRWIIEPDIESIKCIMGLEHLRGQSPEALSLSFTETYQVLSTNWLLCVCVGVSEPLAAASVGQSVVSVMGNRPGRTEPRENKRRPKVLKLMTTPRRLFRAALAALTRVR